MTPSPGQAHDGPPRLTLSADHLAPGAAVEIAGINLPPDQPVTLMLGRSEAEFTLGIVVSDWHGDFTQVLEMPRELPEGTYTVWASVDGSVLVASGPLFISGPPAAEEEGGGNGLVGEEDGLLLPIPTATHLPAGASAPPAAMPIGPPATVTAMPTPPPAVAAASAARWPWAIGSLLLTALGVFALGALRRS